MYGIKCKCYVADPKGVLDYVEEEKWLGCIYPPINIFVYDDEHCERSYRWKTKEDAEGFINDHPTLNDCVSHSCAYVEEVWR